MERLATQASFILLKIHPILIHSTRTPFQIGPLLLIWSNERHDDFTLCSVREARHQVTQTMSSRYTCHTR
jgi:hypothetical protein